MISPDPISKDTSTKARTTDSVGVPVVFLHGFLESPAYWHSICAVLDRAGTRSACVPLPGHPGCPLSRKDLDRAYAEDRFDAIMAERIAETFDGHPVDIVGHSTGAFFALRTAGTRPDLVRRVMGVGALRHVERRLRSDIALFLARQPALGNLGLRQALSGWMASAMTYRLGLQWSAHHPIAVETEALRAEMQSAEADHLCIVLNWLAEQRLTDEDLASVQCPATIVTGAQDPVVTPQMQIDLVSSLPNASGVVMEAGHLPMLEKPAVFLRLLQGWLDHGAHALDDRLSPAP